VRVEGGGIRAPHSSGADKRWVGACFLDLDSQNRDKSFDKVWVGVALRLCAMKIKTASPIRHIYNTL
jgi:hypothetical protein